VWTSYVVSSPSHHCLGRAAGPRAGLPFAAPGPWHGKRQTRTCASKLTPVAAGCIGIIVVESTVVEHAQSSPDLPVPQSARPLWTIGVAVPSEVEMGGTAGVRPQASTYVACTQCVRVSRLVSCDDLGSTVGDPVGGSVQIGSLAVPAVETLEL